MRASERARGSGASSAHCSPAIGVKPPASNGNGMESHTEEPRREMRAAAVRRCCATTTTTKRGHERKREATRVNLVEVQPTPVARPKCALSVFMFALFALMFALSSMSSS